MAIACAEPPALVRREQNEVQGNEGRQVEHILRQILNGLRRSQPWQALLASTEAANEGTVEVSDQTDFERPRMLARLAELSELPDNWDGYGSPSLQPAVQETASALIGIICEAVAPTPHFAPVSGGGLQLEWQRQGRELELEILPDGEIVFLKVSEAGEMQEGSLPSSFHDNAMELVQWLTS